MLKVSFKKNNISNIKMLIDVKPELENEAKSIILFSHDLMCPQFKRTEKGLATHVMTWCSDLQGFYVIEALN